MDDDASWFKPGPALVVLGAIFGLLVGGITGLATAAGKGPGPPTTALAQPAATTTATSGPTSGTFYTVILASVPHSDRGRQAAELRAQQWQARGVEAGVLDSSQYASLTPGFYVVYSGQFPSLALARRHAAELHSGYAKLAER